jgi:hypothetical protein
MSCARAKDSDDLSRSVELREVVDLQMRRAAVSGHAALEGDPPAGQGGFDVRLSLAYSSLPRTSSGSAKAFPQRSA